MNPELYTWLVLPLIIFLARLFDVALGTLRIIFISRGKKYLAPLVGFVEVLIWITIVAKIVNTSHSLAAYLAYAAGFAVGNFVGLIIEDRLALGTLLVRSIIHEPVDQLVEDLRKAKFGVTTVIGSGISGQVTLVYTVVKRRDLRMVLDIIHQHFPHAFLSIEDLRASQEGFFPASVAPVGGYRFGRKSK